MKKNMNGNDFLEQSLEVLYDQDEPIIEQLNKGGIMTIGQLVACSKKELALCNINNAGYFKDLYIVRNELKKYGLFLDGEAPDEVEKRVKDNPLYGKFFNISDFVDEKVFDTLMKYNIETYGDLQEYDPNEMLAIIINDGKSSTKTLQKKRG